METDIINLSRQIDDLKSSNNKKVDAATRDDKLRIEELQRKLKTETDAVAKLHKSLKDQKKVTSDYRINVPTSPTISSVCISIFLLSNYCMKTSKLLLVLIVWFTKGYDQTMFYDLFYDYDFHLWNCYWYLNTLDNFQQCSDLEISNNDVREQVAQLDETVKSLTRAKTRVESLLEQEKTQAKNRIQLLQGL